MRDRGNLTAKQQMVYAVMDKIETPSKTDNIELVFDPKAETSIDTWSGNRIEQVGDCFVLYDKADRACFFDAENILYICVD